VNFTGAYLFLNNQPDALITQIYSVLKLYMFRASSLPIIMEFSTVLSALLSFMQVFDDRFQVESGWNSSRMYSRKLLMMGREDA